jgi:hypothetical protein
MGEMIKCSRCGKEFEYGEKGSRGFQCPICKRADTHERHVRWKTENPEKHKAAKRKYAAIHKEQANRNGHEWYLKNKDHYYKNKRIYLDNRRKTDENFVLACRLRARVRSAVKSQNTKRAGAAIDLIGCSIKYLKDYLMSLFTEGMTWDLLLSSEIEIDHVLPVASFDLTDPEQQRRAFYYTNLQPLWVDDNRKKSDILPDGTRARNIIRN